MYFTYYSGYTTVRSSGGDDIIGNSDDIITRYTFDQEGRVKSTYSTDYLGTTIYGAPAGVYESQDNVKNNLKTTVVVGGSASTYLMNGGFENSTRTAADYWTKSSDNIQYYIQNVTEGSEKAANFIINDYISDSISQYAFLKAGKYTLSAAIYTYNCVNVSLFMRAESLTNSSHVFVEEIPLNEYYASDQSLFASMTFDVSNLTTNGGENFKISFFVESGDVHADNTGVYVSIDNVMLEKNIGASNYSMVQCGNFEGSAINSSGTTITSTSNFWSSQSGGVTTTTSAAPFDRVAYVSGEITKDKYIKQTAYTAPSTYLNDYDEGYFSSFRSTTYLVSGFAKGTGQVHSENSHFSLRVDVSYYQGSGNVDLVDTYRFDFETDCKDWQFVYGSIKTRDYHLVRKIDVYCEYSYQPGGLAYFDEIAIYKNCDDSVVNYFYYENGLLWRKESGYHTEIYEYGNNKQLTRVANNRGKLTDYIYDSNGVTVDHEIEYTFEKNGSRLYPYASADPDSVIVKTPVTKTQYEYNAYGQMTSSSTFEAVYSGSNVVAKSGTEYVTTGNTYETTAGSHIFGALLREDDNLYIWTRYYYDPTNGRLLAVINQDEGTGTCYTYDAIGNVTSVLPATYTSATAYSPVTSSNSVDYTYN
ncbi:MAG: hypothetical protein IJY30_03965, partial [Muribaculaceae bacterium]|nr:hypothetical protein [Muribaculaceae bacterium]